MNLPRSFAGPIRLPIASADPAARPVRPQTSPAESSADPIPAWTQAGFKNGTLSLPTSLVEVVELLRSEVTYLANHPTHENPAAG